MLEEGRDERIWGLYVEVRVHLSLKRSPASNGSSEVLFPHIFVLINLYVHRHR